MSGLQTASLVWLMLVALGLLGYVSVELVKCAIRNPKDVLIVLAALTIGFVTIVAAVVVTA